MRYRHQATRLRALVLSLLVAAVLCGGIEAQDSQQLQNAAPSADVGPLLESRRYKAEHKEAQGTYTLTAKSDDESKLLHITEELTLTFHAGRFRGTTVSCESVITYARNPDWTPVKSTTQTMMNGKPAVRTLLSFDDGLPALKATGVLGKDGAEVDPPREMEINVKEPLPNTPIHLSAIPVLGSTLLQADNKPKDFVLIRCPDDWFVEGRFEPAKFLSGYQLQRRAADDGGFRIEINHASSGRTQYTASYDAHGRLTSIDNRFLGCKFVPQGD